jgi:hypothetical protein
LSPVAAGLLDDIAKVNADAKLDPPLRRPPGIALDHSVLTSIAQRTQSTFRRSGERQDSVQWALVQTAGSGPL